MSHRIAKWIGLILGLGILALAVAWPTVALLARTVLDADPPVEGFTMSIRQWTLFGRGAGLSAAATTLSLVVAIPSAAAVARAGQMGRRPLLASSLLLLLLCPPMVYAFGWQKLVGAWISAPLRCIGTWALWAWPIPAVVIGTAWPRIGRDAFESALLVTTPARAMLRVGLPALRPQIAVSALILFTVFFNDYGVPHACGLQVYPTELLAWAALSPRPIDAMWPSLPALALTGICLALALKAVRHSSDQESRGSQIVQGGPSPWNFLAWTCLAISWFLPIAVMVCRLDNLGALVTAFQSYGRDLAWTLTAAGLAGAMAIAIGLVITATTAIRSVGLMGTLLYGAIPGALVGVALTAGYNHAATAWLYDHWPVVSLSYVARFGWIGVLTCVILIPRRSVLSDQAAVDGADALNTLRWIHLPGSWPGLLCAAWVVTALSVADVAASSLVRVPSFNPIAHVLIEKFHRFEDSMLAALSLWLLAAAIPAAFALPLAMRPRSGAFEYDHNRERPGGTETRIP